MGEETVYKTHLRQLFYEKTEWIENQLTIQGGKDSIDYRPTPAQNKVLSIIQGQLPRISDVARKIGITRQAAHKTVKDLVKAGIVEVIPDANNRSAKLVRITKAGENRLESFRKKQIRVEAALSKDLGADSLAQLYDILGRNWSKKGEKVEHKHDSTVRISQPVYERLCGLKTRTGESLSKIVEDAILDFCEHIGSNRSGTGTGEVEEECNKTPVVSENPKKGHKHKSVKIDRQAPYAIDRPRKGEITALLSGRDPWVSGLKNERNAQLVAKIKKQARIINELRENEERYKTIFQNAEAEIVFISPEGKVLEVNEKVSEIFGFLPEEVLGKNITEIPFVPPDHLDKILALHADSVSGKGPTISMVELEAIRKDGRPITIEAHTKLIQKGDKVQGSLALLRDTTERKLMEDELKRHRDHLKQMVKERTTHLEEANTALRVMLKKEEELKSELEENILFNVKELVVPYLEKMESTRLDPRQKTYLGILRENLTHLISPFLTGTSMNLLNLSPIEIQVANLIKHGKTSKEIADLMNISPQTVDTHRYHIRKKIGITNKKTNLQTYLLSFG